MHIHLPGHVVGDRGHEVLVGRRLVVEVEVAVLPLVLGGDLGADDEARVVLGVTAQNLQEVLAARGDRAVVHEATVRGDDPAVLLKVHEANLLTLGVLASCREDRDDRVGRVPRVREGHRVHGDYRVERVVLKDKALAGLILLSLADHRRLRHNHGELAAGVKELQCTLDEGELGEVAGVLVLGLRVGRVEEHLGEAVSEGDCAVGQLHVPAHFCHWSLEDRVATEVRLAIASQDHVRGADCEELVLELDAVEAVLADVLAHGRVVARVVEHSLHGSDKEGRGACGGVENVVGGVHVDQLSHERRDVLGREHDAEARSVASTVRDELVVEVAEHVEGSHRGVGDDVVHVVLQDAGHPLER